jgi:hypothetical protein
VIAFDIIDVLNIIYGAIFVGVVLAGIFHS